GSLCGARGRGRLGRQGRRAQLFRDVETGPRVLERGAGSIASRHRRAGARSGPQMARRRGARNLACPSREGRREVKRTARRWILSSALVAAACATSSKTGAPAASGPSDAGVVAGGPSAAADAGVVEGGPSAAADAGVAAGGSSAAADAGRGLAAA